MRRIPIIALVVASACTGTVTDNRERAPGGVGDKPVVESPRGPAIGDELVVRLLLPNDAAARSLAGELGGEVMWRGPRTGAYLLRFADTASTTSALATLATRPEVLDVSRHLIAQGSGFSTSPGRTVQWNLPAMSLNPPSQWGSAAGVVVALLDTGVAYENFEDALGSYVLAPDLADVPFAEGYDFVNDDAHANDDHGHGTHLAGVIASTGSLVAVARDVEIMPIKVLGADNRGTELGLAEGILLAAESDADVINLSLSFAPAYFPSRFMQAAVDTATSGGALVVAAAGNNGRDVVTYPAAFREVIAVGASELSSSFVPRSRPQPWMRADHYLTPAGYSNRGYLLDVSAPGGAIDRDIDGDGNPEAILAQSFTDDPTELEYVYYAGTSQAAAQVSGVAAVMLGEAPDLEAQDLRAMLGETADRATDQPLSVQTGRGFVRARTAISQARGGLASRERPHFSASVRLSLHTVSGGRIARAAVEVIDADGHPAAGVDVMGSFTGGVYHSVSGRTGSDGRVELTSNRLSNSRVVAFQVEAVVSGSGPQALVDRPGGFVRIDSCSLDLLSQFGDALATGTGFSTSPGAPLSLALSPLSADELASVLLLNFSWSGATPAMAVVADADWYAQTYPDADLSRVVNLGGGTFATSLRFGAESFPIALSGGGGECVDVVVNTFSGSGFSTSPGIIPDPDGSCTISALCNAYRALFEELWLSVSLDPVAAQPTWTADSGLSQAEFEAIASMVASYAAFARQPTASPVGEYADTLEAAGIGAVPYADGESPDSGLGSAGWRE